MSKQVTFEGTCKYPLGHPLRKTCRHKSNLAGRDAWHCYDCDQLAVIKHDAPFEFNYMNHNILDNSQMKCKFKDTTCDICQYTYPFKDTKVLVDKKYNEPISLTLCSKCQDQVIHKKKETVKGLRHAPLWAWGLVGSVFLVDHTIINPFMGFDWTYTGFIGQLGISWWFLRRFEEKRVSCPL